jgi:hypothetical protein
MAHRARSWRCVLPGADEPHHSGSCGREDAYINGPLANAKRFLRVTALWLAASAGVGLVIYSIWAGIAWYRYGKVTPPETEQADSLLDRVMPTYEVAERHQIRVAASAEITFRAAAEMDLRQSAAVRAIFKGREWIMRSHSVPDRRGQPLLMEMRAIGWGELASVPGHEVVMGAITQPWLADVVFRPLPADKFAEFHEQGWVKIAWTLRADPVSSHESVFRTETRVVATDPVARAKFRRYWAFVSPGIVLIRRLLLGPVKADAERRARNLR